ncbi:FAD-dependent oxidoreductase [Burkholderia perseverans]|uniref:FAD-dependent oxidoreductase n=1 Tax=Burkholderia perseverans TaxID=2615214 RepID=UPI001FEF09D1|nr:FAD-binding protein [Burkholderia perseverans]
MSLTRRRFIGSSLAAVGSETLISRALGAKETTPLRFQKGPRITSSDPRYPELRSGNNQRFVATPEYVRMIRSPEDALLAVQEAVATSKRVSVRSGGHCFADFVCNPSVQVILDLSEMKGVYLDEKENAFVVEAGARLIDVYEQLYKGWGVSLPGGICYSVGAGGHVAGGGYGLLSRAHGLVVDHLWMVELVVVDRSGKARLVRASRDPNDPNHDLWWGHTGGGGGNFGVVTKYWFRSPTDEAAARKTILMAPPSTVLVSAVSFDWSQLDEAAFSRILLNFGSWHEKNSAPDSPYTRLSSLFNVSPKATGSMGMFTQVDATVGNPEKLLDDYMSAILDGTNVTPRPAVRPIGELRAMPEHFEPTRLPWLQATRLVGTNNPTITNPTSRGGHKSAYMKKNFTPRQISTLYQAMTQEGFSNPDTMLVLFSFGGQVNARATGDTANVQRSSVFKMCFQTFWQSESEDAYYLGWLRNLYSKFFAGTGGVPVPNEQADGCYINYPDVDMRNPEFNTSGVRWSELYFQGNYPRLQAVKSRWDPGNFFRHSLSIEPVGA